jgi:hypothetical protein
VATVKSQTLISVSRSLKGKREITGSILVTSSFASFFRILPF